MALSSPASWEPFFGGRGWHPGAVLARRIALRARRAENAFAVQLRKIAAHIGHLVHGTFDPDDPNGLHRVAEALRGYGDLITPWAERTAARMLADVARRDAAGWHQLGQTMNRALKQEIASAPTGPVLQQLMRDQVHLITSLPREAAERVHALSIEATIGGRRWEEIARDILDSGLVSKSRANTIARTETGRAATALMEARATHIESPGYIWRTARDRDVRRIHKALEGTFHRWDDPPVAGERGELAHPGSIYNCRCWPEVILPGQDIAAKLGPRARNPAYLAALRAQGYTQGTAFE